MNYPTECARCRAPLPAAALECVYCRTATPLGVQAVHEQRRAEAEAAAQQVRHAQATAAYDQKARVEKLQAAATQALIFAVVGLPICCAPLSIVGGVMGLRAVRAAQAQRAEAPLRAVIAMVVGALGLAVFTATMAAYLSDKRKDADQLVAVRARLSGKREHLDAKVACDLAEERLREEGFDGHSVGLEEMRCDGALDLRSDLATLGHVKVSWGSTTRYDLTACYARDSRWFVRQLLRDGTCSEAPLPKEGAGSSPTETELVEFEKKARDEATTGDAQAAVQAFGERLARVRDATPKPSDLTEAACPKEAITKRAPSGPERVKIPAVDFDFLDRHSKAGATAQWSWLTNDEIKAILSDEGTVDDKAARVRGLRKESGPLLLVYRAATKLWPVVREKEGVVGAKVRYTGGALKGWMVLFDLETGERLCQAKLEFESSDDVTYKKRAPSSDKARAQDAVEDDLKERFEDAATKALGAMSPALRLGYKILE